MIIVEQGRSGLPDSRTLQLMFEDRKRVFVDLLHWDLPVLDGRFEVDQFDDGFATYLVIADESGDHLGSARLLPTNRPHILGDLFACLCEGPVPTGRDTFEITRFCLSRRQTAARRRQARDELVSALAWYALETGIGTYTGVAEIAWLQQILAFGWDCRPLGPPVPSSSGMLGSLAIEINANTPALLAANGIWRPADADSLRIAEAA